MLSALLALALASGALAQIKGINPNKPPYRTEPQNGQSGYNNCTGDPASPTAKCQDMWMISLDDFCVFAPPKMGTVGAEEQNVVAYCLQPKHGARLLPKGIITSATMIKTAQYIQIKGTLSDQTLINIEKGDSGGEFDSHGYNSFGNPIGGLVFANDPGQNNELTQVVQWMAFIGDNQFCTRACYNSGPHPYNECMHIYDQMGCDWVMPDATPAKTFQTCKGKPDKEPGIFVSTLKNGDVTTSTWVQGEKPTPKAFKPAKTSDCVKQASITYHSYPTSKKSSKKNAHADHAARALPTGHAQMERRVREEDL